MEDKLDDTVEHGKGEVELGDTGEGNAFPLRGDQQSNVYVQMHSQTVEISKREGKRTEHS